MKHFDFGRQADVEVARSGSGQKADQYHAPVGAVAGEAMPSKGNEL
jgi:hypothetical protein